MTEDNTPNKKPESTFAKEERHIPPAMQVLYDTEQQLRLITETISEVFWITDYYTEKILYVSSAYERIWGRSTASLYENPRSYLDAVIEEDTSAAGACYEQKKAGLPWDLQYRIIRPDGTIVWIWDRGYPIFSTSGKISYYVGLAKDITDRKTSMDRLLESEEKYRLLFENAPIGIFSVHESGQILHVNSRLIEILGSPSIEATMEINMFVFPPLVKSGFPEIIRNVLKTKESDQGEQQYTSKWGKKLFLQYKISPIFNKTGGADSVQIILEDITARKEVEDALLQNEDKFRKVFDQSLTGISLTSVTGSVDANRALANMLGYTKDEIRDKKWQDVTHTDDHAETYEAINTLLNGEKDSVQLTQRYIKKDGSIIWGKLSSVLVRDKHNNPLFFISSVIDIHATRQYEDALREHNEQLERSVEERTKELNNISSALNEAKQLIDAHMENSLMAIIEFDRSFRIVRWSKMAERIFGWTHEEAIGKTYFDLDWVHAEDFASVNTIFSDLLSGKIRNKLSVNRNYRKDGSVIFCEWYNSAIYDHDGKLRSFISSVIDITARKQLETIIAENEERLQKAFRVAPTVIAFTETDTGKFIDVNDHFCRVTGFSQAEVTGKTAVELGIVKSGIFPYPPAQAGAPRKTTENQVVFHTKTGERAFLEFSSEPAEIGGKNVVLNIGRDITDHGKMEEMLSLTQFAVEHSSDATYWINPDARFEYVNQAACLHLGYSKDELLDMTVFDVDPDFPKERWMEHWEQIKKTGSFALETRHRHKNGQILIVEVKSNYVNYGGREYNCAFARDISLRKAAELDLKKSAHNFQMLVENSGDVFWTMNSDLVTDYVSPSVIELLGYTAEEHVRQSPEDFLTAGSATRLREEIQSLIQHAAGTNDGVLPASVVLEVEFIRNDKTRGVALIHLVAVREQPDNHFKILGTTRDITGQKQHEHSLLQKIRELEHALSSKL